MPGVEFGGLSRGVNERGLGVSEMGTIESFVALETGLGTWDCGAVGQVWGRDAMGDN